MQACPSPRPSTPAGRPSAGLPLSSRLPALSALTLAVALLSACGGGDETPGTTGTTGSGAVILSESAKGLSVTLDDGAAIALAASSGTGKAQTPNSTTTSSKSGTRSTTSAQANDDDDDEADDEDRIARQWTSTRYTLSAQVTAGSSAGQSLTGALLLRALLRSDGTTRLEGRFVPSIAAASVVSAQTDRVAALRRQAYRDQVEQAAKALRTGLASGDAATAQAALAAFQQSHRQATDAMAQDVEDALSDREAGGRTARSERGGTVAAVGRIDANGHVTLTLSWNRRTVKLDGHVASDGSLSGTFTDTRTGDTGTWQALPPDVSSPAPAPAR